MFGSQVLEVVIGLAFIYLLLSLICSIANELIARIFAARSKELEKALRHFLENKEVGDKGIQITADGFYGHSLIKSLGMQGRMDRWLSKIPKVTREGRPSYIPSGEFALALFDTVVGAGKSPFKLSKEQTLALNNALVSVVADKDGIRDINAAKALKEFHKAGSKGKQGAKIKKNQLEALSRGKAVLSDDEEDQLDKIFARDQNLTQLSDVEKNALKSAIDLLNISNSPIKASLEKLKNDAENGQAGSLQDDEKAALDVAGSIVTAEEYKLALQGLKARLETSGLTKEDFNALQMATEILQRDERLKDVKEKYISESMVGLTKAEKAALDVARSVLKNTEAESELLDIVTSTKQLTAPFELNAEEQQTLNHAIKALPLNSPIKEQLLDIQNQSIESRDLQTYSHTMFMQIQGGIEKLDDKSPVKQPLKIILNNAMTEAKDWDQALAKARKGVETWFDNYMERASGWYKRNTQTVILILAFFIAFVGNVDTIVIGKKLWVDATLRESVANQATTFVVQSDADAETSDSAGADAETETIEAETAVAENSDADIAGEGGEFEEPPAEEQAGEVSPGEESLGDNSDADIAAEGDGFEEPPAEEQSEETTTEPTVAELQEELRGLGLPIGWYAINDNKSTPRDNFLQELPTDDKRWEELTANGQNWEEMDSRWLSKVAGMLITALLVSLGAPFWFDLLSKLVNIRSTGKRDDGSKKNQTDTNLEVG